MVHSRRLVGLWMAGLVALLAAAPAARADGLRLTLEDALARAKSANGGLLASGKQVDTARANVERSAAWVPENPYVTGGLLQTPGTGFGPSYGFSISQEFEVAGQRSKRMAVADAGLRKAEWDQKNQELDLNAAVKTAFVRALLSEERLTLAQRNADLIGDLSKRELSESRGGSAIDRNQLVIQDARTRKDVIAAETERAESFDALRYLLGMPATQEIELAGTVDRKVKPLPSEADLLSAALEHRPDLIALRSEAERTEKQIPLVKREGIPNLTLAGNYSRFQGDDFAGGDVSFYLPVLRSHDPELLEAAADRERAQYELDDLKRAIERDVRQAHRLCAAAGEDLRLTEDVIVLRSRENVDVERRRFEKREVDAAELIGMLIDLQVAEKEYLDSVQTYNDAWIDLEKTVGGDL